MSSFRRSERYPFKLRVQLKGQSGRTTPALTEDVAFHGVFIRSDVSRASNELVKFTVEAPDQGDEIELMAIVARCVTKAEAGPDRPPGLGVSLFGNSRAVEARWVQLIRRVKAWSEEGLDEPPPKRERLGDTPAPAAIRPERVDRRVSAGPRRPARRPPEPNAPRPGAALRERGASTGGAPRRGAIPPPRGESREITPPPEGPAPARRRTPTPRRGTPIPRTPTPRRGTPVPRTPTPRRGTPVPRTPTPRHGTPVPRVSSPPPREPALPSGVLPPEPAPPSGLPPPTQATPPPMEGAQPIDSVRRKHVRRRGRFNVTLRPEGLEELERFELKDISEGGTFVLTPTILAMGTAVNLRLIHPTSGETFSLPGRVVRAVDSLDPAEKGMGIQFTGPSVDHEAFERFVGRHAPRPEPHRMMPALPEIRITRTPLPVEAPVLLSPGELPPIGFEKGDPGGPPILLGTGEAALPLIFGAGFDPPPPKTD